MFKSDNFLRTLLRRQDVKLSWTTCCVRGTVLACSNSHVSGLNSNCLKHAIGIRTSIQGDGQTERERFCISKAGIGIKSWN